MPCQPKKLSPCPLSPDATRSMTYVSSADGRSTVEVRFDWDEVVETVLGVALKDVEGTEVWWKERIHPEDRDEVLASLHRHLNLRSTSVMEQACRLWDARYRMRKADGTYIVVCDRLQTSRDPATCIPLRSVGAIFDQARRIQFPPSQTGITGSTLSDITDALSSCVYLMDAAGVPIYMNPSAEETCGFTLAQLQEANITFHEAIHSHRPDGRDYPISECPLYVSTQLGTIVKNQPEVMIDRNGNFFPIVYSISPISRSGYEFGSVVEFRDVSVEKEMEKERLKAQVLSHSQDARIKDQELLRQKLTEFIDFISHEVRNPLHGIQANVEFLRDTLSIIAQNSPAPAERSLASSTSLARNAVAGPSRSSSPSGKRLSPAELATCFTESHGYLDSIHECASHQMHVVDMVLDLSRLESGKVQVNTQVFSPLVILRQTLSMMGGKARMKDISLGMGNSLASLVVGEGRGAEEVLVKGDATMLQQVILNLVGNAIKFTPEGGNITASLSLREDHGSFLLEGAVKDTGVGMTDSEMETIFLRFHQANRQVSSQYGGSGLGLSICSELVRLLEGTMTVSSVKNEGSTFGFTLRLAIPSYLEVLSFRSEQALKASPSSRAPSPSSSLTRPSRSPSSTFPPSASSCLEAISSSASETTNGGVDLPPTQDDAPRPRRFRKILCAEDNALNRKILAKYLHSYPCVVLVEDGQKCLDYFKGKEGRDVDLIFMDCEMPVLDGRKAASQIRDFEQTLRPSPSFTSRVPIIALTGNARSDQQLETLASGMDEHLTKPCRQSSIEGVIRKWEAIVFERSQEPRPPSRASTNGEAATASKMAQLSL